MPAFKQLERRIVALSCGAHALVHAEMLVFAVVLVPLSAELDLSLGELGSVGTLSYFCFGAGAPLAGWLADRWGPARVLAACMLGSAAALAALALARGLAAIAAAYVGLGIAASLYHPAGLGQLSISVRHLGKALGLNGMAGNVGLAVKPFWAAAITDALGWRAAYAALVPAALILGLGLLGLDRAGAPQVGDRVAAPSRRRRYSLPLLLALAALLGLVYRGSLTFLPARFLETFGAVSAAFEPGARDHALSRAGLVTSGALLGGMLGQYLGGRAAGGRRAEGPLLLTLAAAVPLLAGIALLRGPALVVTVSAFLVVHFANQPLTNSLFADYSRREVRGRTYGFAFASSFGVGAFAAGLGGWVADAWGVHAVFLALAALGVLALLIGLFLWRVRPGAVRPAGEPEPAMWVGG